MTSGLCIGASALATRGFGKEEFSEVAEIIAQALQPQFDEATSKKLRARVEALATANPLYPNL